MAEEKKKRRKKSIVTRGKRKEAIARAYITEGNGRLVVNGLTVDALQPLSREIISEPLQFVKEKTFDVSVSVHGGGISGQAQAARTAVARAMVAYLKDDKLKEEMVAYDRSLLVEDPRRVEPKKFKGPKARARFTKSYR
ncbi:MAG: 30S ribosomal protein S9 [Candidatus Micrarchaeota archaeon]